MSPEHHRFAAALAAVAPLLFASGVDAASPADPFAGLTPLSAVELAELRGGFVTVDGLKIAFAVTIAFDFDGELGLQTWLKPEGLGGFVLTTPEGMLMRDEHGALTVLGDPQIDTDGTATTYDFGTLVAKVEETANGGFRLTTDGDLPIDLDQTGHALFQTIGDLGTTMAETRAMLGRVSSILSNTRNDTKVSLLATMGIDVLNHGELFGSGAAANPGSLRIADLAQRHLGLTLGR